MIYSRRSFILNSGLMATVGLAGAGFLPTGVLAAQGGNLATARNLIVVYLAGGNDGLSMVAPYRDTAYFQRRPTLAIPPSAILQLGTDSQGTELGFHPALVGLKRIFDQGHMAIIPRTGYQNASRSHFVGSDILSTGLPEAPSTVGWLGRYLDSLQTPIDPLLAWNTEFQQPRSFLANQSFVASITNPTAYTYLSPWGEQSTALKLAGLNEGRDDASALINQTAATAIQKIPRVATVAPYKPSVAFPNTKFGKSLELVSAAISTKVGSKIFWVQTEGYDTHARQGTLAGTFSNLMSVLDAGLSAIYSDLSNQGLLENTTILVLSEFGRRIDENGSLGTDHGAAGPMLVLGGSIDGGFYGTAAKSLKMSPDNPDLENEGRDLAFNVDYRSVYASLLKDWLDVDPVPILRGQYFNSRLNFIKSSRSLELQRRSR
jgi:uncharacterized protein (DUF1501 family)